MAVKAAKMNVRHDRVLEYLRAKGEVSVQELAERLSVSLMTIRRDLMILEDTGQVTRTHGGAILSKPGVIEFSFAERGERNSDSKRAIAQEVAAMIRPGSTIALDNGTTTLEVAKAVAGHERLTVLTSSLAIASVLYTYESIELVLLGGLARKGSPDLTGWLTNENLKHFRVDYSIVGADGVLPEGVYTYALDLARTCQAVLGAGSYSILVADHSKIGRSSFLRYATLGQFDQVVTDSQVPAAERQWLDKLARKVTYVEG